MDAVRPSPAVTAAGVDHVRLSYAYLDEGDVDAYGSLFDEHAHVSRPDTPLTTGGGQTAPRPPGRQDRPAGRAVPRTRPDPEAADPRPGEEAKKEHHNRQRSATPG